MLASLLGALTYYVVQPEQGLIPVTFALGEGRQFLGNYSILEGSSLVLKFTFLNGSAIKRSLLPSHEEISQGILDGKYLGEFDAAKLQSITLSVHGISGLYFSSDTVVKSLVAYLRDRIMNVTLVDQEMTNLGSSKRFGVVSSVQLGPLSGLKQRYYNAILDELMSSFNVTREELSSTDYWKVTDYIWSITVDELDDMLHGSGTANIFLTVDIKTELKYRLIRTSGEDLTGSATLSWAGTLGTVQLTHEDGKISWVNYNFTKTVALIMIVNE
jgi:hypothetical protein